ncbi:recombinase family protein [Dactylosporangium sp. NPDC005555]|uniref:recombinase family protein n=1 Tax=Dactylosporangium sp. NPDC005555 TaxID=3154889 RepID=UPI0033B1CB0E
MIPVVTDLLNRGVTIISITEGEFRRGNVMDLIHLIMRLDASYNESRNKSIAVRSAKAAARELGGYLSGKPPYGFALVPESRKNAEGRPIVVQTLVRRDDEAGVIRRVVARILDVAAPATMTGVAAELNECGVPTRGATIGKMTANSAWGPRTLTRILSDPRIAGFAAEVVYCDRPRPDGRKSASVAGYRIVCDDDGAPVEAYPSIIDPETWFELQSYLSGRPAQAAPLGPPRFALLSALGLLYCECGSPMKSHRHTQRGFRSAYRCSRARGVNRPGAHQGDCTVSQGALNDYVARRIFALMATAANDPETLGVISEATRLFAFAVADPAAAGRRGAIAVELDDARRTLDRLYDDRAKGGYSGQAGQRRFLDAEVDLSHRVDKLAARLTELDAVATPALPIRQWLGEPGEDPVGPDSWWVGATMSERRALVTLFVRRITIVKSPTRGRATPVEARTTIEWVRPVATTHELATHP